MELAQHGASDVADADDRQGKPRARLEKALMNRVQGADLVVRVDDAGDVALGAALRDRADIDVLLAERIEYLAGDAGTPLHALADDRENRLVVLHVHLHRLLVELELELVTDGIDGARRIDVLDAETDGVLGRRLRDEHDVDL